MHSKKQKGNILAIFAIIAAITGGLAAFFKNIDEIVNSGLYLTLKMYGSIFTVDFCAAIFALMLAFYMRRVVSCLEESPRDYFGKIKSFYPRFYSGFVLLILASCIALGVTYYHARYYRHGLRIGFSIVERQMIDRATLQFNKGNYSEATSILRNCVKLFDSYSSRWELEQAERRAHLLDTATWIHPLIPANSSFKLKNLQVIKKIGGESGVAASIEHELTNEIKMLENEFITALKKLKEKDLILAVEMLRSINGRCPGYGNSHLLIEEIEKLMHCHDKSNYRVNDTIYLTEVMNAKSVEEISQQLNTRY